MFWVASGVYFGIVGGLFTLPNMITGGAPLSVRLACYTLAFVYSLLYVGAVFL